MTDWIFKNKTANSVTLDGNPSIIVPAGDQIQLTEQWTEAQIRDCVQLAELISQGSDNYQLDDLTASEALRIMSHAHYTPGPVGPDGTPLVIPEPRQGSSAVIVTHNWCDRCTWYGDSVRVTGETLIDSGDGLTFNSAHQHWIDLIHGRMYAEDKVNAPYLPKIYVEGVEMTERTPWADSGGDYQIDYEAGKVTFFSSQTGKTITADYSYENGSTFYIRPESGKKLQIEKSEVQFSQDVNMTDTINFQAWAYNPADPPNKVPAQAATVYKHIRDFVDEAEGVYPTVPALGGSSGRGLTQQHIVFPFNYKTVKQLYSSIGLEIRIWLSGHQAFGGEFATASFYCVSEDE